MSFSFQARGTRDEVVASLDALTEQQIGNDALGLCIKEALVDAISAGTELTLPADQRYVVNVFGHSGRGSLVTLNATVKVERYDPLPEAAPEAQASVSIGDAGTAQDAVTATS